MKKIIVVAATEMEIAAFRRYLNAHYHSSKQNIYENSQYEITILITGVGMMNTAFSMGNSLAINSYDAAIQAGIAGAFDSNIALGTVVSIDSEQYGDLGAEDNGAFLDIMSLGFISPNEYPLVQGKLLNQNPYQIGTELPTVSGLSVNTVSGNEKTILSRKEQYNCQTESMEGIAFHFACLKMNIPFVQIRAISNYVTPRNKADWQINLALENLNQHLINCFAKASTTTNEINSRL